MGRAKGKTPKPPKGGDAKLTIAIVGEGVSPDTVDVRQLAALLDATANAFEAIADEKNIDRPRLSLTKVKDGSAAYELASHDRQATRAFTSFVSTVKRRGKTSSRRTRDALLRLHTVATKAGTGLRVEPPKQPRSSSAAAPILLAPPLAEDDAQVEEGTVVHGRIVGIRLDVHEQATVTIRYDDGGTGQFGAETDFIERAARLIGRNVAARVTYLRGETRDFEGDIEDLEERAPASDVLVALREARDELVRRGIKVSAKAWLAEERGDD